MHIRYFNDGKCKDGSWEAHLVDDTYYANDVLSGYGPNQREAHEALIVEIQKYLAGVHKTILETPWPEPETEEERASRHRNRYGYLW